MKNYYIRKRSDTKGKIKRSDTKGKIKSKTKGKTKKYKSYILGQKW